MGLEGGGGIKAAGIRARPGAVKSSDNSIPRSRPGTAEERKGPGKPEEGRGKRKWDQLPGKAGPEEPRCDGQQRRKDARKLPIFPPVKGLSTVDLLDHVSRFRC